MSNELVEDSEPEREYIRNSQKARRKGRGNGHQSPERGLSGGRPKQSQSANRDIIDISSDASGIFAPPATPVRKVMAKERIIDISDSPDNSSTSPDVLLPTKVPIPVTQSPIIDLSPIRPSKLGMYSHSGDISYEEGEAPRPTLNRFALPPAQPIAGPSKTRQTSSRPSPTTSTTPDLLQEKPPAKCGRPVKADLLGDLCDTQLLGLLKCVCCDVKWTTRKSSAQKASHISTCARKHKLAALAVRDLIRKELDNAPSTVAKSARGVKEAPVPPSQSPTRLEDIVNHAEPKKRGRRHMVAATVQGPVVAQNDILDRARAVLRRENAPATGHTAAPRRPLSTSGHASPSASPIATQPFRKSALAGKGCSFFFAEREDRVPENPPATQAFAASRLGDMSRLQAPAPIASTSAISVFSSSDERMLADDNDSANVQSPRALQATRMSPLPDARRRSFSPTGSDYFDYANDDFYNIQTGEDDWFDAPDLYDSGIRYSPPPLYFPHPMSPAPEERVDLVTIRIPSTPATPSTTVDVLTAPTVGREPVKKKIKKAAPAVVLDDEALEVEMKKLIIADDALYLRILRFEPIHFEVFYELALSLGVSDRKLKVRVRAVLDKQVISHYGAEPGDKRTRKHHA